MKNRNIPVMKMISICCLRAVDDRAILGLPMEKISKIKLGMYKGSVKIPVREAPNKSEVVIPAKAGIHA
jgi:hypothetical protein